MLSINCGFGYSIVVVVVLCTGPSFQNCPEEVTSSGIKVKWNESPEACDVKSDPQCFFNDTLVKRNCTNNAWTPPLESLEPCYKVVKHMNVLSCPPGFQKISVNANKYCYHISEPFNWNYPCLESGGATVITELAENEIESLLTSLNSSGYNYFWLPGRRENIFAPVMWHIPGPNWGQVVEESEFLPLKTSIIKNCLLFDSVKKTLITEACNEIYPSLCFFINDLNFPAKCPEGYYAFRHILDEGRCFGIEKSEVGLTYQEFTDTKCETPMGIGNNTELRTYIFTKVSESINILPDEWCWFSTFNEYIPFRYILMFNNSNSMTAREELTPSLRNTINTRGTLNLMDSTARLSCMACETDIIYDETELTFEYNPVQKKIYLTVYYPSGLWKYNNDDRGIQCFSDAKGFFKVVDVYESTNSTEISDSEKSTYIIDLVTDRSARYWCEGHTKNISLIATEKIVVNPCGSELHVFSLVLETFIQLTDVENIIQLQIDELTDTISYIFKAEKVLLMHVLDHNNINVIKALLHLHVPINNTYSDESLNLLNTYESLKEKVAIEFPKYNYTFINISSSIYCLQTSSQDSIELEWGLTPIGHVASPKQFCLQSNGLPVYRQCHGSYLFGGFWDRVKGLCDKSFEPSVTTELLFNFVHGKMEQEFASRFLTTGLEFVFNDTNIIIPADIYYISVSFQQILHIARINDTDIETGDIENIAWIMDRIMVLDKNSLQLAQNLNSTNVILDSITNLITMITNQRSISASKNFIPENELTYQIAIQPRFILQISYPDVSNITGIAVINVEDSDDFSHMKIQPLYKNSTLEEILAIKNLEVATYLPQYILNSLKRINNDTRDLFRMHIVINVYYNDVIFQELGKYKYKVNSRIIEVSVPGYSTTTHFSVPLFFGKLHRTKSPLMCGYWDFHSELGNIPGTWSNNGCILITNINNVAVCECYHLTHFGQLINVNGNTGKDDTLMEEHHRIALNIITLIGSGLSLIGIIGIWITAIVFDMWRRKTGTKVLLQLSTAIALPLILIIIFNVDDSIISQVNNAGYNSNNMRIFCIILGALFHYSVLANFVWMLITAVLQFIRYVRVLGVSMPSRFMFKLTLIGWGLPLIPVLILLVVNRENYIPSPEMKRSMCYPSGTYMIASVIVPICIILLINVILFLLVIKAISKKSEMRITDKSLVFAQLRVSIFLFFLLGLTWIFGVMSLSGSVICSYLFCLTATVQGFVLFIYFVICDPTTRNLWVTVMKPQFITSSRNSITTISSG